MAQDLFEKSTELADGFPGCGRVREPLPQNGNFTLSPLCLALIFCSPSAGKLQNISAAKQPHTVFCFDTLQFSRPFIFSYFVG